MRLKAKTGKTRKKWPDFEETAKVLSDLVLGINRGMTDSRNRNKWPLEVRQTNNNRIKSTGWAMAKDKQSEMSDSSKHIVQGGKGRDRVQIWFNRNLFLINRQGQIHRQSYWLKPEVDLENGGVQLWEDRDTVNIFPLYSLKKSLCLPYNDTKYRKFFHWHTAIVYHHITWWAILREEMIWARYGKKKCVYGTMANKTPSQACWNFSITNDIIECQNQVLMYACPSPSCSV